ncbi:Secreted protein OS=Streptomyces glaucescens OX=1907 GN=SGLAU_10675 PE=4 SV=1 [Streptomyces glaucescens]
MNFRRSAAALAAAAVIGVVATPVAQAADPSPSATPSVAIPSGLYGSGDPTYDGVWRQSLALLAQDAVGVRPAGQAVDWLTGQQCANGAFASFRADTATACDAKTMLDTNATSAAVQALAALGGHDAVTGKAVGWLKSVQNKDGGWGFGAGSPSDANRTVHRDRGARRRRGEARRGEEGRQVAVRRPARPRAPLRREGRRRLRLPAGQEGRARRQRGRHGRRCAGRTRQGTRRRQGGEKAAASKCADAKTPEQAAANGAAYLAGAVAKDGHLVSALPGAEDQPDFGNTADAVVALAAQGGAERAAKPLKWLEENWPAGRSRAAPPPTPS